MSNLRGSPQLKARLRAIALSFKPIGRDWADETVRQGRPMVAVRTGRLRKSMRRKNASMKKASVEAHFTATFVDGGTKPHAITGNLRFDTPRGTVFAKRVHHGGARAKPFKQRAAKEALRRTPMAEVLIEQWNRAA